MTLQEQLRNLEELRDSGVLTEAEFEQKKALLLNPPQPVIAPQYYSGLDKETRQWAMILHLSQFAGYVIPLAGLIAPIVIWQVKKSEMPALDEHGKIVANWMLSAIIYAVISIVLIFLLIGIPMLLALGVMAILFPIIGGIKANNGELWKYPLSIPFFK
jgi:uncharacterized protein